jgi:hypothetical protein
VEWRDLRFKGKGGERLYGAYPKKNIPRAVKAISDQSAGTIEADKLSALESVFRK